MPTVTMPDGTLVDMPENPTAEQLSKLKALQQTAPGFVDKAKAFGKSMVSGFGEFAAGAPDAAGMLFNQPGLRELADSVREYWSKFGETKDIGPMAQSVAKGIGGGLAGGPAKPVMGALVGGTSGGGSQLAANAMGDTPANRLVGGLVGGVLGGAGAGLATRVRPQTSAVANEALEGLTPAQLKAASDFQAMAASKGAPVDLAQALEAVGVPQGNLTTIRNVLANSKSGNEVQALLKGQPAQLETLAGRAIKDLPGDVVPSDVAANTLQQAATDTVKAARDARAAQTAPLYAAAGRLPQTFRADVADSLSNALQRPGISADAAGKIREALSMLKRAPGTQGPMSEAADYDRLIRELAGPFKGNALSNDGSVFIGDVVKDLKTKLRTASPETRQAAALHAQISQDVVDPLKKGLVGQFATPRGARSDIAASQAKLVTLLNKGEDPASGVSNIAGFASKLKAVDPRAFPDAVKTYVSGKLGEAFPAAIGNAPVSAGEAASNVYNALFANRNQYNGLKQAVAASADSLGQSPTDMVRGLDQFAQITKAMTNRPAGVGGLSQRDTFKLSGQNYGADALRIFSFLPAEKLAGRIDDAVMAKTFREFDRILTSPDGAAKLAALGRVPVMSKKALTLFATIGGTAPNVQGQEQQEDQSR